MVESNSSNMNVEAIPMGLHRLTVWMDACGAGGTSLGRHKIGSGGNWGSSRIASAVWGKFLSRSLNHRNRA